MGIYLPMILLLFWQCVLMEAAFVQPIGSSADLSNCYDDPAEFEAVCKDKFYGFVDGGRCYFVSYQGNADWNTIWKACQMYGASLAQIYTASEYSKMAAYTQAIWGSGVVSIALRDETTMPACVLQSPTVSFYDDVSSPNTLIRVNDTWLGRNHGCDDNKSDGLPRCIYFWISPPKLYDDVCNTRPYVSVCHATNAAQNYTKTNVCMNETPIQSHSIVSPQECAEMCSGEKWCRSFNMITTGTATSQCQLFTWATIDTKNTRPATADCYSYTYVA